ncbi:MAG TPA: hypothetical protein GXX75_03550 [Clostridiales bacterium]|nr:hypothetical protein [Clostridiales bacterium]
MEFMKKQKKGFVAYVIVAVMAVISFIVYVSNVSTAYYQDMNTSVVIMMVCALALIAATLVLPQLAKGRLVTVVVDVLRVASAVLIILSGVTFIGMRVESFGYIFGSNLELGNEAAFRAGSQAITGIVLFVVTWILSLAASFFEVGKKNA